MMDRKAALEVGFDEGYQYGLHDLDFAARWLHKYGGDSVVYVENSRPVWHIGTGKDRTSPPPEMQGKLAVTLGALYEHKYHFASGLDFDEEAVNVDLWENKRADVLCDCMNPSWMPDGFAEQIRHKHFIEHIPMRAAQEHINVCARKLVSGGVLEIAFPDVRKSARALMRAEGEAEEAAAIQGLYGDPGQKVVALHQLHRWGWHAEAVADMMRIAGLEVEYKGEDDTAMTTGWRDSLVEGRKP